jgi:O-antigen/teichoic acid export membrane protein
LFLVVVMPLVFLSQWIDLWVIPEKYRLGSGLVLSGLIMASYLNGLRSYFFDPFQIYAKRFGRLTVINVFNILCLIILNWIWIEPYGLLGVAGAQLTSAFATCVLSILMSLVLPVRPFGDFKTLNS